jgi:hypothetical protein
VNKLAIVGTHPATRDNAPFTDPDFDIWVFNEAPQAEWCKRWTHVFQMHKPEVYTSPLNMVRGDHWEWLQQDHGVGKTIFMQEIDPRVPCSSRYPLDEMREQMPAFTPLDNGKPFITSTVAMAIPLALYLGYEHIEIYGVDLASNTEYTYQQNGWMYWAGVARATLGAGFILKSGEHHFNNRLYAYEGETQIDREFFAARVEKLGSEKHQLELRLMKLRDRFNEAVSAGKADKLPDLIIEAQNTALALGEAAGAAQEAQMYAERTDPISRQQFERRGAQSQQDGMKLSTTMDKEFGKLEYVFNAWKVSANEQALKQMRSYYANFLQYSVNVGAQTGIMRQNFEYLGEYDARITAAGGERTLKALGVN